MRQLTRLIFAAASISMLLFVPTAYAGTPLGKFCFKLTKYAGIFVWDLELVGSTSVTVTGMNTANQSAMSGGGSVVGSELKLIVAESASGAALYGFHSIKINLSDLSGVDDIQFHKPDGTNITLLAEALTRVSCP